MPQPRHGSGFTLETRSYLSGEACLGSHDLDRDIACKARLTRFEDVGEPTSPDQAPNLVPRTDDALEPLAHSCYVRLGSRRVHGREHDAPLAR